MRTGQGFLAIWSDVRADQETDYLHWLTREHTEERVSIPGFLGVRVFRSRHTGDPRYFILYTLESAAALASPAYLARLNAPSPWSSRIMPILMNFRRGGGTVVTRLGAGSGAVVAPILLDGAAVAAATGKVPGIAARDRVAAASLLAVDGAGTGIATSEKTLRSGDRTFDALLLVEALDAASLATAAGEHEVFDQVFALDKSALTA